MSNDLESSMLIDQWRTDSSVDSPAGPLYLGGDYVESDIVGSTVMSTTTFACTQGTRVHDNCCN
ncbi:MAG: hypothetical protein J0I77_01300 [Rudaea sp.]|uniref:DUF6229 family protein n=1 Tax=unclassified Rudaea TaxID=2627037 RepID=UPI0010F72B34|nr:MULTISPECIES: DUF6229 family protein [unclassified Rudaea]MBN8884328.1 hypothetical protein [Rudaea sp.]MBR0346360.1 hypothetical protein [Rudaea sp.]